MLAIIEHLEDDFVVMNGDILTTIIMKVYINTT